MLYRDLKAVANESVFNPNKPDMAQKITLDVGNPKYWTTRAIEKIMEASRITEGSVAYHQNIKEAITLLILTRAKLNEQNKKSKKTGDNTTK